MFPAIISGYRFLYLQLASLLGYGWAIVALSFVCSLLMLPLMRAVAGVVRREKEYEDVIDPQVVAIKAKYASDMDRHFLIQRLYARYGYSPLSPIKKVCPLFVQIPFLLLTYYMLKGTAQLSGVSFLFLADLGRADALLPHSVNLLPLAMTGVNILTVFATPGFSHKDWTQAIGISLLFLVLLYTAPSALLLYWTLNNVLTFLRTLLAKEGEGIALLSCRVCYTVHYIARLRPPGPRTLLRGGVKLVRNYLILNICAFLPALIVIFGFMPDRFDVQFETRQPLSVGVGFVTADDMGQSSVSGEQFAGCLPGSKAAPLRYFFADDFRADAFTLRLAGPDLNVRIKSVSIVRNLLVRYRMPLDAFCAEVNAQASGSAEIAEDGSLALFCSQSEFRLLPHPAWKTRFRFDGFELPDLPGTQACLWLFQLGLVGLAFLGIFLGGGLRSDAVSRKSAFLAFAASFFLVVVLPCQSIFANRAVFDFPVFDVVCQIGFWFASWWLLLFVILRLSAVVYGCWMHVLLLAFLVFEYLQTGVLAMGYPSLDGNLMFYMMRAPGLRNLMWLAAIFAVVILLRKFLCARLVKVSIAFAALAAIALFESQAKMSAPLASGTDNGMPWKHCGVEIVRGLRLSPLRNVILLIPDSMQSDAANEIILKNDSLRSAYRGFCAFNNNVGMHAFTQVAIPGLLTGRYCPDPAPGVGFAQNYNEYAKSIWSTNSVATFYEAAGNPVFLIPGVYGAHSNRIKHKEVERRQDSESGNVFFSRHQPMGLCLMDCLRFRLVPFLLKPWAMRVSLLGIATDDGTHEERTLYPNLAGNPLSEERRPTLTVLHTNGSHMPVHYDADGNRLWKDKDNYAGMCGQVHFVLKCIAGFLEGLKKAGVYDKSMIVIVGDHGNETATTQWPGLAHVPSRAIPMLWVKPFGATNAFSTSTVPTSHAKVAELLKRSAAEDLDLSAISEALRTERRLFRNALDYQTRFEDYCFDEHWKRIK